MKLFAWVKRVERWIVPQAAWDWYYGLPKWPRNFVNWVVVHGGITALVVLLFALPGMLWLGDQPQALGAWVGYGLGAGFYITKEVVTWRMGGSKWPSLDQVGDAVGPVIVGLIAVWLVLFI